MDNYKWFWESEHYNIEVANKWCIDKNLERKQNRLEPIEFKIEFEGNTVVVYGRYKIV